MSRQNLIDIFNAALNNVDPYNVIKKKLEFKDKKILINGQVRCDLSGISKIVVIGAGKAAAPMAQAVEETVTEKIDVGIVIVKYGHTRPLCRIRQIEASHPIPDGEGIKGTEEIIKVLREADEKTLVICLLSGGASSLLTAPLEGISLGDKIEVTRLLLMAGAAINELNAVRKHLSAIKGGRLAETAYPAALITFILSDVMGNRLDVIASGPTVPDNSTFNDAMDVIEKYGLEEKTPAGVMRLLNDGLTGRIRETPKGGEKFFNKSETIIIGSLKDALDTAKTSADSMGFCTEIITSELSGEARDAALFLANKAIGVYESLHPGDKPWCLLSGGETTVTVKGRGTGGRNQELALKFAIETKGRKGITMLSAGTDGTDGPTDAAGAIVDGETILLAENNNLDPVAYLENNDSYNFFKSLDSKAGQENHFITGPTGTNVMDLQIIIVEK